VYKDHWHAKPIWMKVHEDSCQGFELNILQTPSMYACVTTTCCSIVVDLILLKILTFILFMRNRKNTHLF
jgi:hypothetical protein